ncbi:hypothetical protein CDD80_6687 [Ophiocordyceps camponoti-rufipedis]|uniref:Nodulin-like domain-containing protein n=1 Tax=Ophiocordyceps camponoti-rufipedis TaxID=2004952 RepID=A0A2C5YQA9_9HYPO|nr:hypothetical protein CDD80_6687 [Ophiocordyceps camponoti-rufipedis]
MVQQESHNGRRIAAGVAATLISLACGTNYVYSAWAPQFAERLGLSSTESNFIGSFGNLGVYSLGVPVGIVLDRSGPRVFVLLGSALLAAGYFALHQAYDSGSGYVPALCFYSFVTGLGSCMAFAAAVKTSALNWPHHRGTATAFPVAAFGLSAFFFSSLGSVLFPGDPSAFLKLLSWGTFCCTLIGFFFLRTSPQAAYHPLACSDIHSPPDTVSSGSANRAPPGASKSSGLWPTESGVGSDFLAKRLHASRIWCLAIACVVFLAAQVSALVIQNPNFLGFVSGFSGLGYGLLFGVFPSLVTEAFGIRGLSQNWGFMTLAPVLSSSLFNLFYGQPAITQHTGYRSELVVRGFASLYTPYIMSDQP